KSVGEVMAIGRTFQESVQKALRGLEIGTDGFNEVLLDPAGEDAHIRLRRELGEPGARRIWYVAEAFRMGYTVEQVYQITAIDPWFLVQIEDLVAEARRVREQGLGALEQRERLYRLKRKGFSDRRLAALAGSDEATVRRLRHQQDIHPVYKRVDSCAGEFATSTAYLYSTYEEECEAQPSDQAKIMVLGGGPNRIGQGIEFDYCCVHAALALREDGYETIMVNCNPETVSTDFDTSDRLYFEPLTLEDVLEIVQVERPKGVVVQYGGQTPLKLARALEANGVPIIGTSPDAIDRAEDRERFQQMLNTLGLKQPPNRIARDPETALQLALEIGYPLVVRPSYVLGGRAMEIVHQQEDLNRYIREAVEVSEDSPVLLDRFLNDAVEVDADAVCDGQGVVVIGGIMEHIEEAGVHSGDSACSLPPHSLSESVLARLREQVAAMARELGVVGLMNVQFAIQNDEIYVLEVNPRASRTVPYVSKATGRPLAKIAARCMAGRSLAEQGITGEVIPDYYSVKEAVFPFIKFPGVDPLLGPEMKSTGEVMGVGRDFGEAFAKAQLGAGNLLPRGGRAFVSVRDLDKPRMLGMVRRLVELGFEIVSTQGTAAAFEAAGIPCRRVNKVNEGRPHIVDMIKNDQINLIINTTEGKQAIADSFSIRREALMHKVSYTTTVAGARATVMALGALDNENVHCLQALHRELNP
ncbi:MAG: carbamoyl-phosphate synthase large subunit, partial [Candidatus Competibacteraceae bacterium]|nr:carbamoyl-phosphate synthase large subunit [Candidatus Competibacteraceae bacterium]